MRWRWTRQTTRTKEDRFRDIWRGASEAHKKAMLEAAQEQNYEALFGALEEAERSEEI